MEIYCIQPNWSWKTKFQYLISTGQEKKTAAGSYTLTKESIDTIASFIKSITYHKNKWHQYYAAYAEELDKLWLNIFQCE